MKKKFTTAMPKKIKVTKRAAAKTPWYERQILLFGVLAILLAIGGVVVAHLYIRSGNLANVLGSGTAPVDSAATTPAQPPSTPQPPSHVLAASDPLTRVAPGQLLPPVRVSTLGETQLVRREFRVARDLGPVGASGYAGEFAYADAAGIADAVKALPNDVWAALPLLKEQRSWKDFEVQRDATGRVYVVGFVSVDVAEQIGALGPDMTLPPPATEVSTPGWQIWKKRGEKALVVRQGTTIALYPDPSPDQTVAIVLPFDRIASVTSLEVPGGVARRTETLDVTLR